MGVCTGGGGTWGGLLAPNPPYPETRESDYATCQNPEIRLLGGKGVVERNLQVVVPHCRAAPSSFAQDKYMVHVLQRRGEELPGEAGSSRRRLLRSTRCVAHTCPREVTT